MAQGKVTTHDRTAADISPDIQNIQNISDPAERLKAKQRAKEKLREKLQKIESKLERLETPPEPTSPRSLSPSSLTASGQASNGLSPLNSSVPRAKPGRKKLHTVLEAPSESPKRITNVTKKFDILSFGQPFLPPVNNQSEQLWAERFYWANDGVYLPFPVGYKARRYVHGIEHVMEIQKDNSNQIPVFYVHIPRQDFFPHDDEDETEENGNQKIKNGETDPERRKQIQQEFLDALPENTEVSEKYISFYNKTSSGVWQSVVDYWNIQFRKTNSKHRVSGPLYFGFKEDFVKDELYQMMKNVTQFIPEKLRTKLASQHVRIPPSASIISASPSRPNH